MSDPETKIRGALERLADEAPLDPGMERRTLRRARRRRVGSAAVALAVSAGIVVGGVAAVRVIDTGTGSVPAAPATPTPTNGIRTPSHEAPTLIPSPSFVPPSPTGPAAGGFAADLGNGRYIAYPTKVDDSGDVATLQFDLAQFLTGDAANQYAAAHGMETPVPDDSIIVNENPRLRLLPLSPGVEIDVVDYGNCSNCAEDLKTIDLETFTQRLRDAQFPAPYWLTIRGDTIVKIQEQYQP